MGKYFWYLPLFAVLLCWVRNVELAAVNDKTIASGETGIDVVSD